MPDPEIKLCGRLEVTWGDKRIEGDLPGRQGRLLFAFLVLNRRRAVRRDELVEALWADEGLPNGGEALLAPPLSRLRKALGTGRLEGRSELTLELGPDAEVDWESAQELLNESQRDFAESAFESAWDRATRAEGIFGGGLLPGLEARWIEEYRSELEELRLMALETAARAGARLGPGEQAKAERAARTAVEASPFRESARIALIEVISARGNIAEALRSYEEIRILLREELGTFPSPELTALHEQLLNAHEQPESTAKPTVRIAPRPTRVRSVSIGELIDPRIGSHGLVGRSDVLLELQNELEKALTGELRIALLGGEGGVGKTRLAAELAASRDDISVLYGRCEPDEVRPFHLWSGLLRTALTQIDECNAKDMVGSDGPILSRILPELSRDLGDAAPGPPTDLESERQALFGAVLRTIGRITRLRPLLIVLDDLHWADRSTLLLLSSLAGDNPPKGVLALGTFRDTELPPGSFLLETLINLQRHRPAVRFTIGNLEVTEVRDLVRGRVDDSLAETLHDQTGGNPFFIEQMLRHLEEAGDESRDPSDVPPGLREIISQRVLRLPEGAAEVLRRASLIGRDFDLDILLATTNETEDRVIELLDAAVMAGLLDESPVVPGRYSFVHALLRSILGAELGLTRRTRIHRSVGEAIEQQLISSSGGQNEGRLGELAWHFSQAGPGESDRATLYSTRAAEQAEDRLAYDEAVDFYDGAIFATRSDEPVDEGLLARLLIRKANAQWRMGALQPAADTFFEAADAARLSGLPELLAEAAIGTNWGSWEAFDVDRQGQLELLEEALVTIGPADGPLLAQLMGHLGHAIYLGGTNTDRARELMLGAREMVGRIDHAEAEFEVLLGTCILIWEPQNHNERLDYTRRLVDLAEGAGDSADLADALAWRSVADINYGLRVQLDADQERHARLSRTIPQAMVASKAMKSVRCFLEGRWDEGEELTVSTIAGGMPDSAAMAMGDALLFMVKAQQGRLGEYKEILGAKHLFTLNWDTWPIWQIGELLGLAQAGQEDEAREMLDRPGFDGLDGAGGSNITKPVYFGVAGLLFGELGDTERASRLAELIEPYPREWTIFGPAGSTFGPTDLMLGEMRLVSDQDEKAMAPLENAIEMCLTMNSRPYLARAQLGLAEALTRTGGDQKRIKELKTSGTAIAEELGMTPALKLYS